MNKKIFLENFERGKDLLFKNSSKREYYISELDFCCKWVGKTYDIVYSMGTNRSMAIAYASLMNSITLSQAAFATLLSNAKGYLTDEELNKYVISFYGSIQKENERTFEILMDAIQS